MQIRPVFLVLLSLYAFLMGCGNASESSANAPGQEVGPSPTPSPVPPPDEADRPSTCEEPKTCKFREQDINELRRAFLMALEHCRMMNRDFPTEEFIKHKERE